MAIDFPASPATNDTHTSGGRTWTYDGESWVSTPTAVVTLGTNTDGDYVQSLVAGTGVTVTNNSGEGATPTVAIGQAVGTTDSPTFNSLTVNGDLTVSGTTTTVNSTTINVEDPVITVGTHTNDYLDRGVAFKWMDMSANSYTGFFGFSDTDQLFTFIQYATDYGNFYTGTPGDIKVGTAYATGLNVSGSATLPANTSLPERYTSKTASTSLALADLNYVIEVNSSSAVTITVPADAGVLFPVGTVFTFVRVGTGEVTIAAGSGATINTPNGNRLRVQWSTATLRKRAANTWLLSGDIKV